VTGGMLTDLAMFNDLTEPHVLQKYRRLDMANEIITQPENLANTMGHPFAFQTVTRLKNNKVLIAGGTTSIQSPTWFCDPQEKVIFYYPQEEEEIKAFGIEQIGGNSVVLFQPRAGHTATELDDGTVLLAGGFSGKGTVVITDTAEIYNPASRVLRIE
jgi:hypothetical protein